MNKLIRSTLFLKNSLLRNSVATQRLFSTTSQNSTNNNTPTPSTDLENNKEFLAYVVSQMKLNGELKTQAKEDAVTYDQLSVCIKVFSLEWVLTSPPQEEFFDKNSFIFIR